MIERFFRDIAIAIIGAFLLVGCNAGRESFDVSRFTEEVYTPIYAKGFTIRHSAEDGATLITVQNPWQGAEGVEKMLLIDPRGKFSTVTNANLQRIEGEAARIVCLSSSHIAMLDALGQTERVVGVSGIDFITNDYIVKNRDRIGDVGYDNNMNYELLIALDADIVLLYGVKAENSIERKLYELGIPYLYIGEYVEQSPLGKAEWLITVAEITGQRTEGIAQFKLIEQNYNSLLERVAQHIANQPRPRVMINTPYRDSWVLPPQHSYITTLVSDAGGDCYTSPGNGTASQPIDIEQALIYTESADLWINVGGCNSLRELTDQNPRFAATAVVTKGLVYNNNARRTPQGGSDFWESGVVRPDLILKDLTTIFHPDVMGEEHTLYYYKQLK
ncbi:MAG: ABC transporter substrate-binding protein [Alistipes sp.]|nr:ABC transporter substrate-binding protein [Alistipes sp.]